MSFRALAKLDEDGETKMQFRDKSASNNQAINFPLRRNWEEEEENCVFFPSWRKWNIESEMRFLLSRFDHFFLHKRSPTSLLKILINTISPNRVTNVQVHSTRQRSIGKFFLHNFWTDRNWAVIHPVCPSFERLLCRFVRPRDELAEKILQIPCYHISPNLAREWDISILRQKNGDFLTNVK